MGDPIPDFCGEPNGGGEWWAYGKGRDPSVRSTLGRCPSGFGAGGGWAPVTGKQPGAGNRERNEEVKLPALLAENYG